MQLLIGMYSLFVYVLYVNQNIIALFFQSRRHGPNGGGGGAVGRSHKLSLYFGLTNK